MRNLLNTKPSPKRKGCAHTKNNRQLMREYPLLGYVDVKNKIPQNCICSIWPRTLMCSFLEYVQFFKSPAQAPRPKAGFPRPRYGFQRPDAPPSGRYVRFFTKGPKTGFADPSAPRPSAPRPSAPRPSAARPSATCPCTLARNCRPPERQHPRGSNVCCACNVKLQENLPRTSYDPKHI